MEEAKFLSGGRWPRAWKCFSYSKLGTTQQADLLKRGRESVPLGGLGHVGILCGLRPFSQSNTEQITRFLSVPPTTTTTEYILQAMDG